MVKPASIDIEYYCYDFDVFCKYGKIINPSFSYFSDKTLYHDQNFDLLMASSSLWYESDWQQGVDNICKFNAEYVYITRMIFILNTPSYVAIQNPRTIGYETEYLFWVLNKFEFLKYMKKKNLVLIREFEFGNVNPVFKAPEQGSMMGFLFKKIA